MSKKSKKVVVKPIDIDHIARKRLTIRECMHGPVNRLSGVDWVTRKTKRVMLTMPIVRGMLLRNTNNRAFSPANYKQWRDVVLRGEWQVTNQGIAFLKDGTLGDGQHRLAGILLAGISVEVEVTYGLTEAERDAIDIGRKRTVSDIASIRRATRGEDPRRYQTQCGAVARVALKGIAIHGSGIRTSNNIVHFMETHDDLIQDYVIESNSTELRKRYHSGWVGAFVMAALIHGRDAIDPMLTRVRERDFYSEEDPLAAFDRVLSSSRTIRRQKVHYGYAVSAITSSLKNHKRKAIKGSTTDFPGAQDIREEFLNRIK